MSALDNVALPLLYAGVPLKERRARAEAALQAVGLEDRIHFLPNQLSGGQCQRVAIARAIVTKPALLLADEPTGALDYNTGKTILRLLYDLCKDTGKTVIVITHNSALKAMADRVILIKNGQAVSQEINEHPEPIENIEW
jgi:putative ABC transport system ATP-binding protein